MKNSQRLMLVVLYFLILHPMVANAQKTMTKQRLDSIDLSLVNFFKELGYFEKDKSPEKCLKTIHCNDLLSNRWLGDDPVGIYLTGTLNGRTRRFILIVESNGWKIENSGHLSELEDMTAFFRRHKVNNNDIDKYLKAVLEVHEYNNK